MYQSVNAIRYVNPAWDKVSEGNRLYPSLLYLLRIKKYDDGAEQSANQEQGGDDMAIDETLMMLITDI